VLTPEMLLDYLGIKYRVRSNRLSMCCVFHGDRNPSAGFYLDSNKFYCFTCRLSLTMLDFYAKYLGLSSAVAEEQLREQFGFVLDHESAAERAKMVAFLRGRAEVVWRAIGPWPDKARAWEEIEAILWHYGLGKQTPEQVGQDVRRWESRWTKQESAAMLE